MPLKLSNRLFRNLSRFSAESVKGSKLDVNAFGETPAIALCKLLIAINPDPIKPAPKKEDIESTVVEASFA